MPKKKKKLSTTTVFIVLILIIATVSVTKVAWHDGKIGATPLGSINDMSVDSGTPVTVRGTITSIISGLSITINEGTGAVIVPWTDTATLAMYSLVVVRAVVNSVHTLRDTVSVQPIWLFA
ncbi:MAG: hypothetical protein RTV31_00065 [Candidatus Thorarchaeota archaeon]